jgi:23S rRNA (cytidine1920-2'-O)/16S rRNA (cytidine1409-2'-O)-methyltransferase
MRLDKELARRGLVQSRSQAENLIRLGKVKVNGNVVKKAGRRTDDRAKIEVIGEQYVSRAAHKLASAAEFFSLNFNDKTMLDVGSSTGGFTDYALRQGAKKVVAVDVGTEQLHPSLRKDKRIELHEKTDIREFKTNDQFDLVVIDVSFVSLRDILPSVMKFADENTQVVAMLKPQFEASDPRKHKGVIKNSKIRRNIIKDFELWLRNEALIVDSHDSDVSGKKGNTERFYLLKKLG